VKPIVAMIGGGGSSPATIASSWPSPSGTIAESVNET
jgi:hypothetical protein